MSESAPESKTDESKAEASPSADGTGSSSPLPGCIILITVVVVFGFLVTLFTVVFHKQTRLIDEFTEDAPIEVSAYEPSAEQVADTDRKMETLMMAAIGNEMDRILFSADDLNTLIATRNILADMRGTTYVVAIDEETGIETEMTQPLRSGFLRKGIRYLNGTFYLKPEKVAKTVLFTVADIEVSEKEVPDGFVGSYPAFMKIDPELTTVDQVLPKIDRVYLEGDKVVVETRVELLR